MSHITYFIVIVGSIWTWYDCYYCNEWDWTVIEKFINTKNIIKIEQAIVI